MCNKCFNFPTLKKHFLVYFNFVFALLTLRGLFIHFFVFFDFDFNFLFVIDFAGAVKLLIHVFVFVYFYFDFVFALLTLTLRGLLIHVLELKGCQVTIIPVPFIQAPINYSSEGIEGKKKGLLSFQTKV